MKTQLIATASAAVLSMTIALATAYAQAPDSAPQGGAAPSAPAAQSSGPSGGDSPGAMNQRGQDAGAGQSAGTDRPSGEKMGERTKEPGTTDRDRKKADTDREPTGKSAEREGRDDRDAKDRDRDRKSAETKDQIDRKSAKTEDKDRTDRDSKSAETGDRDRIDRDRKSAESGDRDRADRDRGSGDRTTVKIDADQKQKVRTYFSEHRPTAKRVEKSRVSVSIGAPLPTGVDIDLIPLPSHIVVVAADCPLQYFLWGDDVVLVDSCSREVVDIIPNLG